MDPKRDIVDTICHASRAIRHNPTLGFPFPTMWGVARTEKQFTQARQAVVVQFSMKSSCESGCARVTPQLVVLVSAQVPYLGRYVMLSSEQAIYTGLRTSRAEEGQVSRCSMMIRLMSQSRPFEWWYISPLPAHQLAISVLQILINLREFPVCKLTLTGVVAGNTLLVRRLSLL